MSDQEQPPPPTWAAPGGQGSGPADPPAPPAPAPPPPPGVPPPPTWAPGPTRVGLVPLHPMSIGEVMDTAFRMLRACAAPAVLLVLLTLGPVQVLASVGVAFQPPIETFTAPVPEDFDVVPAIVSGIGALLSLVVAPLTVAALTWLGAHADATTAPRMTDALRHGARRYWATVGAFVLLFVMAVAFAIVGGLLIALGAVGGAVGVLVLALPVGFGLLVGLLMFLIIGYLTVPAVVVEGHGPISGISRAWRLARRRFWPTVGTAMLLGLVFGLLGLAVSTLVSLPGLLPISGNWVFAALGGTLNRMLTVPLGAFAALAMHVDQRIRTEGYDVAVLVDELRR